MDETKAGDRTDREIFKSALAQMQPREPIPNRMLLVVDDQDKPVSFDGIIGEMDASGELNGAQKRIVKVQVKMGTLQIENRAAEAEEMRRMEGYASNPLGFQTGHVAQSSSAFQTGTFKGSGQFDQFILWLEKRNPWLLIAIVALVPLCRVVILRLQGVFLTLPSFMERPNLSGKLFLGALMIPFLETVLFQTALIYAGRRLGLSQLVTVILTAALFALEHWYLGPTMAWIFVMGVLYSTLYLSRRYIGGHPFLSVMAAHGAGNALLLLATVSKI
jgi:hypothetical protein